MDKKHFEFCESLLRENDLALHEMPDPDEEPTSSMKKIFDLSNDDDISIRKKLVILYLCAPGAKAQAVVNFYYGEPYDDKQLKADVEEFKKPIIAAIMSSYGFYVDICNFVGIALMTMREMQESNINKSANQIIQADQKLAGNKELKKQRLKKSEKNLDINKAADKVRKASKDLDDKKQSRSNRQK